jgi:hypothetical protein
MEMNAEKARAVGEAYLERLRSQRAVTPLTTERKATGRQMPHAAEIPSDAKPTNENIELVAEKALTMRELNDLSQVDPEGAADEYRQSDIRVDEYLEQH